MQKQRDPSYFPDVSSADRNGLVVIDPRIDTARLRDAYRNGIFPWPSCWDQQWTVGWFSPDPRAILPLKDLQIPSRLLRKMKAGHFRFRWDSCFDSVIDACASVGKRPKEAWLSPPLIAAIKELHRVGDAHSIEVFDRDDRLCGGLYGIVSGAVFSAESMFHTQSDASKAAICCLVALRIAAGFEMLDIQQSSPTLLSLGAVELARSDYLVTINRLTDCQPRWPAVPRIPLTIAQVRSGG